MKSKILMALLSILISFGLWLYVVTVISPESEATYYNIPVVLEGKDLLEENDLMLVSSTDLRISSLKLFGNRADLNKLSSANITILADLSQITKAGVHNVKYTIIYPGNLQKAPIEVLEQNPQYITIEVAERISKEVPVRISYTGSVPDSYRADLQNAKLSDTAVTVSGPKDVIEKIDHARITVDLTGQTSTIDDHFQYTLCGTDNLPVEDISAVEVNVSKIHAKVPIYREKVVPVVVQIVPGGGIPEDKVTILQNIQSVTLSGNESTLEKFDRIVVGPIDLGKLTESTTIIFPITVPKDITVASGEKEVSVSVTLPAMATKTFEITDIRPIHVPDGRYVEVQTAALQVTIRGLAEELYQLEAADIVVTVDCQELATVGLGNFTLKAVIEIPDFDNVGAVGDSYSVNVSVSIPESGETEE